MNPKSFAPIDDDAVLAQHGQMSRYLRLRLIQGMCQLANAQLAFGGEQQQQAKPCLVGERSEERKRFQFHDA